MMLTAAVPVLVDESHTISIAGGIALRTLAFLGEAEVRPAGSRAPFGSALVR